MKQHHDAATFSSTILWTELKKKHFSDLVASMAGISIKICLPATVLLCFQLISAPELCNLTQALSHLALRSHMVHLASMADLGHHDVHQPATLCHIRNPLHLGCNPFLSSSVPHFSALQEQVMY